MEAYKINHNPAQQEFKMTTPKKVTSSANPGEEIVVKQEFCCIKVDKPAFPFSQDSNHVSPSLAPNDCITTTTAVKVEQDELLSDSQPSSISGLCTTINDKRENQSGSDSQRFLLPGKQSLEVDKSKKRKCLERPLYKCGFCLTRFSSEFARNKHANKVHKNMTLTSRHSCPTCKKYFGSSQSLKDHQNVHSEERLFLCLICDIRFKTKSTLKNHFKSKTHRDQADLQLESPHPSSDHQSINNDSSLLSEVIVSDSLSFPANSAPSNADFPNESTISTDIQSAKLRKSLRTKSMSKSRQRQATSRISGDFFSREWDHKCDICLKTFVTKQSLKKHQVFHSEVSEAFPFECSHCDMKFRTKDYYENHLESIRKQEMDAAAGKSKKARQMLKQTQMNEDWDMWDSPGKATSTPMSSQQNRLPHGSLSTPAAPSSGLDDWESPSVLTPTPSANQNNRPSGASASTLAAPLDDWESPSAIQENRASGGGGVSASIPAAAASSEWNDEWGTSAAAASVCQKTKPFTSTSATVTPVKDWGTSATTPASLDNRPSGGNAPTPAASSGNWDDWDSAKPTTAMSQPSAGKAPTLVAASDEWDDWGTAPASSVDKTNPTGATSTNATGSNNWDDWGTTPAVDYKKQQGFSDWSSTGKTDDWASPSDSFGGRGRSNGRGGDRGRGGGRGREWDHKCDICLKTFVTKQNLKKHQVFHSEVSEAFPFECSHCDMKFRTKDYYENHLESIRKQEMEAGKSNKARRMLKQTQQKLPSSGLSPLPGKLSSLVSTAAASANTISGNLFPLPITTTESAFSADVPLSSEQTRKEGLSSTFLTSARHPPVSPFGTLPTVQSSSSIPEARTSPPSASIPESQHHPSGSSESNRNSFTNIIASMPIPTSAPYYYPSPVMNTPVAYYAPIMPTNFPNLQFQPTNHVHSSTFSVPAPYPVQSNPHYSSESPVNNTIEDNVHHPNKTSLISTARGHIHYPFVCTECNAGFVNDIELRFHMQNSHPSKCFKCPVCFEVVLSPEELRKCFQTHKINPIPILRNKL